MEGATISWDLSAGGIPRQTYFQTNWTVSGNGRHVHGFGTLTLRVSLQCGPSIFSCSNTIALNDPSAPTDFSIALVAADGSLSDAVHARDFGLIEGPVGSLSGLADTIERHPTLQSLRVPLEAFGFPDDARVRGVRLTFDRTLSGAIYVANIRFDREQF